MEEYLLNINKIPNKNVVNDILSYFITKKNHLFSNICNGRTPLQPGSYLNSNENKISLYEGGYGFGNYIEVAYLTEDKVYAYYTINDNYGKIIYNKVFTTNNWNEMHDFVKQHICNTLNKMKSLKITS